MYLLCHLALTRPYCDKLYGTSQRQNTVHILNFIDFILFRNNLWDKYKNYTYKSSRFWEVVHKRWIQERGYDLMHFIEFPWTVKLHPYSFDEMTLRRNNENFFDDRLLCIYRRFDDLLKRSPRRTRSENKRHVPKDRTGFGRRTRRPTAKRFVASRK